ncbi:hypothetical protein EDD86DRAFT_250567 [Gorgonomyces haynaldii]|nr:hypothetical protein EDD86DRAFT_250567 [Gorgonomyces haynaldii]
MHDTCFCNWLPGLAGEQYSRNKEKIQKHLDVSSRRIDLQTLQTYEIERLRMCNGFLAGWTDLQLKYLDLSGTQLENLDWIIHWLPKSQLASLNLYRTMPRVLSVGRFFDAVSKSRLESLNFSECEFNFRGTEMQDTFKSIQSSLLICLNLCGCFAFGHKGIGQILDSTLECLHIGGCCLDGVTDDDFESLVDHLPTSNLKQLNLAGAYDPDLPFCNLSLSMVSRFAQAVSDSSLETLDLSCFLYGPNEESRAQTFFDTMNFESLKSLRMTTCGVTDVCLSSLKGFGSLESLAIGGYDTISCDGVQHLAGLLVHSNVQTLSLYGCQIKAECKALESVIGNLKHLNLCGTKVKGLHLEKAHQLESLITIGCQLPTGIPFQTLKYLSLDTIYADDNLLIQSILESNIEYLRFVQLNARFWPCLLESKKLKALRCGASNFYKEFPDILPSVRSCTIEFVDLSGHIFDADQVLVIYEAALQSQIRILDLNGSIVRDSTVARMPVSQSQVIVQVTSTNLSDPFNLPLQLISFKEKEFDFYSYDWFEFCNGREWGRICPYLGLG